MTSIPNLRGKPGALQYGIDRSHGEIILMTDADCTVHSQWVKRIAEQFSDESVGLVSGLTSVAGTTFLERTQDVEWTYTQSMAAGGVGNGFPLGCFGNNLAVRRETFLALGGYRGIEFSVTEDLALQHAVDDSPWEIRFAIESRISVETLPCDTMLEYIKQRHRWVRGGVDLGWRGFSFVMTSIALWIGIAVAAATTQWGWLVSFAVLRLVADGVLISRSAFAIRRMKLLPFIIPAMILLVPTELFLPLLAMRKKVTWKNQVFRP